MTHPLLWSILAAAFILLIAGFAYEARSRRRDALRFPPPGQLIDVGGHRLHLLIKGSDEPTVVIEQGAGGPSLAWFSLQEQIARFARVCLYDRAGYQWSDAIAGSRSIEDRVKDLYALLNNADSIGPYVLVAHSYGGFLVRLFARTYPESVAGLVLVDTPHEDAYFRRDVLKRYTQFEWLMGAMKAMARIGVPRLLNRAFAGRNPDSADPFAEQLNASMVRREYYASAQDDVASLRRARRWLCAPGALGSLGDLPLLVITHGQPFPGPFAVLEQGWREGQIKLAALSSNSDLVVAEKANHMIHLDEPQIVLDAVRRVVEAVRTGKPLKLEV